MDIKRLLILTHIIDRLTVLCVGVNLRLKNTINTMNITYRAQEIRQVIVEALVSNLKEKQS